MRTIILALYPKEPIRSGLLEVICEGSRIGKRRIGSFLCLCDCGRIKPIRKDNFEGGKSKSCGCRIGAQTKHGYARPRSREYRPWEGMKRRCYNPNVNGYKYYGGRGIVVCSQWLNNFDQFLEDMGPCPNGMTLERAKTDGNYCPENCRWDNQTAQQRNRRNNRLLTFQDQTKCLAQWAEDKGFTQDCLGSRLDKHGYSIERALTEPPKGVRR